MKIRALKSFSSGALSMAKNQIVECNDKVVLQDLLEAKFIEEIKEKKTPDKRVVKSSEGK